MKDIIKAEFMKIKRKKLFLLILLGELASFFITYIIQGRNTGKQTWVDILYNFSGFNFMIMIIIFTIVISKLVDVEYKADMWKLMFTAVSDKNKLFAGKFICVMVLIAFSAVVEFFGIIVLGTHVGAEGVDYPLIFKQCALPLIGYLPVIVLQFGLSSMIKNQSISIAGGVVGCFLGVFGMVMPFHKVLIWTYPFLTAPMTIFQEGSKAITIMNQDSMLFSFVSIAVAAVMFFISLHLYNNKENF